MRIHDLVWQESGGGILEKNTTSETWYVYLTVLNFQSLVAWWSEFLTTNHEVPGSIPGCTMCVFSLKGEDDRGLGSW